mmetsp:Transcript_7861/g.25822  ORF Transcript_7861/g.25822 Transcript_7861/m.25822 type:complete len:243 (-) Transcript_7861:207-935(-)
MMGVPLAMASTWGRPQPSPRVGRAATSALRYKASSWLWARSDTTSTGATASRPPRNVSSCSRKSEWYALVRSTKTTSSSLANAAFHAFNRTSHPFRFSHLNTDTTTNPASSVLLLFPLSKTNSCSAAIARGLNASTSTGSPKTKVLETPARRKMSAWNSVGTQTSSTAFSLAGQPLGRRSVSNMVRPTTTAAPRGGHGDDGHDGLGTCHAPGSEWQTTTSPRCRSIMRLSFVTSCPATYVAE